MDLLLALIIILVDMSLMILYEFTTGLIFKFRGLKVPWVYRKFEDHEYRSISAFSSTYFLAWLGLALIKFIAIELLIMHQIIFRS